MMPGTMYTALRSPGLYQGRTRMSSGGPRPVVRARSTSERAAPACAAPDIAALEASGSAASTTTWASAVRPRRRSERKVGGTTTPAIARPARISRSSAFRSATYPTMSKLPVFRSWSTSARLSVLRDSSSTTVGR